MQRYGAKTQDKTGEGNNVLPQHLVAEDSALDTSLLALPDPIPIEVAFEHIGYFTPASKRIKDITTKEKVVAERTNPDGSRTTLTVHIIGTGKYGLPITADLDYYRAFLKLLDGHVEQVGQLLEPIPIPAKTLIRYAGKQTSVRERGAVIDWIRRSHFTGIQGFYYQAATGEYVEISGEPLFPRYLIRGQRLATGEAADTHAVWLASWFRANYLHHHVRPMDLALHLRLRKPIAKSLYPLLDLGWYATDGQPYSKSYRDLCHEFLLQEYRYLSQIKQQLDPAHGELVQERFLERWEYRPAAKGRSWVISYYPGPKFFEDQQAREARRHLAARIAQGTPSLAFSSPGAGASASELLTDILAVCGDRQNQAAYQKVLQEYPEAVVRMALAETRQADHAGRIRKTRGAYFMDTLKRLTTLRTARHGTVTATATPAAPPMPPPVPAPPPPTPAQVVAATAVTPSNRAALVHVRQQTHTQLVAIRQRLTPEQLQQFEAQARAQVSLGEQDFGYGLMVQSTVEALLCQEYLGFDCWPRLVTQVRASGVVAEEVLAACSLEAIVDEVLVVSVPTVQDHARLTAHVLEALEELASTPTQRRRIRVLVR
jgi:hypothetical protein